MLVLRIYCRTRGGMQSLFSDTIEDRDLRPNRLRRKQLGRNSCGGGTVVKRFHE